MAPADLQTVCVLFRLPKVLWSAEQAAKVAGAAPPLTQSSPVPRLTVMPEHQV
jgi:hypothetical protein